MSSDMPMSRGAGTVLVACSRAPEDAGSVWPAFLPVSDLVACQETMAAAVEPVLVLASGHSRDHVSLVMASHPAAVAVLPAPPGFIATCAVATLTERILSDHGVAAALRIASELPGLVASQLLAGRPPDDQQEGLTLLQSARSLLPGARFSALAGMRNALDSPPVPSAVEGLKALATGSTDPTPGPWAAAYVEATAPTAERYPSVGLEQRGVRRWTEVVWWDEAAASALLDRPDVPHAQSCEWCGQVLVSRTCAFCRHVHEADPTLTEAL